MQLFVACNLIPEGVRMRTRRWIISHRRSWMTVYVLCCNAHIKSHSNCLACMNLYSINCAHHTFLLGFQMDRYYASIKAIFWRRCRGISKHHNCIFTKLGAQLHLPRQLSSSFSGAVAGEKKHFCKGSLSLPIFLLCYCFAYFIFAASLYQKHKKISCSFYSVALFLFHYDS